MPLAIRAAAFAAMSLCLPLTTAAAAEGAADRPFFDLPHLQRELDNGLRVIVVRTPQQGSVSVQIPVQTGSRNEIEDGKSGFAHFFEHMMFRGTPKHPAAAYGAAIKAAGADQNAFTTADFTNYYTNITPADLDRVLELEADRFQNLAYSEEQFRTEALAVKGEYLKNYANPLLKGFEKLQALAFTAHTYGHTTMGYLEDIEDMPNQMTYSKAFFDRWYRPEYSTVVVAGDVELEPTFELVKKHFGGWQRGDYVQEIPAEPAQDAPRYAHLAFTGPTLPWLLASWKAPSFTTERPDTVAQAVIAEAFFGTGSALHQRLVVKERKVDQIFAQPSRNRDPWLFTVAFRLTDAAHAPAVVAALEETLLEARSRALEEERFEQTRSRMKYAFAAGLDSAARIGLTVASFAHYERDLGTLNRYYASLDRLTAEQTRAAADAIFADRHRNVVSIANAQALPGAAGFRGTDPAVAAAREAATASVAAMDAPAAGAPEPRQRRLSRFELQAKAAARAFDLETIRLVAPVVELPSDSPLVDVSVVFSAGAAADPPGKKGLAALTAALLAQGGSANRTFEEIQKATYPMAASLSAQVDKDMMRFSGTVHRDNAAAWWAIVGEQLHSPGFRQDDLDRVREQLVNAIRVSLRANNDEELAKELVYAESYGAAHPYGTLTLGDVSDLQALTLDDVKYFYRKHVSRMRMTVGIAGGYDEQFRDDVLSSLVRMPRIGQEFPAAAPAPKAPKPTALVVRKETPAVAVSFGVPLEIRRGHPDWVALWLARSWLGEHRNSSGRLYDRIREARGMNYGTYAYIEYFPNGMFRMQPEPNYARANDLFQVWIRPLRNNNDALFATRAAVHEVRNLVANGLSDDDFERTRAFLRKFVSNLTATQAAQLGYAIDAMYFKTGDFQDYVRRELDALTAEKVNAALKRHLDLAGIRYVFVASDADDLAKRLARGAPSPIEYNTDKPAEMLAEDKRIQALPLGLTKDRIRVVDAGTLCE
ncbi:MAG: M16 family metallopeptidase [Pseudomonadota bacterium]